MHLFTVIRKRWIVIVSIVVVIFELTIWVIRPSPVLEWLRSEGSSGELPVAILAEWADGRRAPMTPVGFLTLFHPVELGVLLALLATLSILVILLPPRSRIQRMGSWISKPITSLRLPRISVRVQTAMVLIAVLGLYLGWENVAWRTWRLRDRYRRLAADYALEEARCLVSLKGIESALVRIDARTLVLPDDTLTPAAQAASKAYLRDSLRQRSAQLSALSASNGELKRKYERAAADPLRPLAPDAPFRLGERSLQYAPVSTRGQYDGRLVECDELIRRYPDLDWAHQNKAWILSTSPDASYRDGRRAVAAATRAAELTNWKNGLVLSTLAAAYAEAGDFASAVRWQEQALQRPTSGSNSTTDQERLALYKAGKPFRMPR
jgi:tetratricopeptide (TPR) repeat protein